MKYLFLAVLVMSMSAFEARGEVRSKPRPRLLVHGALAFPVSPEGFSEGYTIGLGGGAGLGFQMAPPVRIAARVEYTIFTLDADGFDFPETSMVSGGEARLLYASADLRIELLQRPTSLVRPYFIGGMGYFRLTRDDLFVDGVQEQFDPEDTVGLHGGAGLDISLAPFMDIFFEAVFIVGFTQNRDPATDRGGNTVYVPFRIGLSLELGPQDVGSKMRIGATPLR